MRAAVAQLAADVEARTIGQHHVEHDQVDLLGGELLVEFAPVGGQRDAEALLVEIAAEQFADFQIVINDQYVRCRWPWLFLGVI